MSCARLEDWGGTALSCKDTPAQLLRRSRFYSTSIRSDREKNGPTRQVKIPLWQFVRAVTLRLICGRESECAW